MQGVGPVARVTEGWNKKICMNRTLFSSLVSQTTFDENFKVTSVLVFLPDFNFWSCEFDNFTLKVLHWVILYWYYLKATENYNTLTVYCEKAKVVSLASSMIKNINPLLSPLRLPVKLICCTAFG